MTPILVYGAEYTILTLAKEMVRCEQHRVDQNRLPLDPERWEQIETGDLGSSVFRFRGKSDVTVFARTEDISWY